MGATAALEVVPELPGLDESQRERFLTICDRIAHGDTAKASCERLGVSTGLLWKWSESSPEARRLYARARVYQAHSLADEVITIADGSDPLSRLVDDLADLEASNIPQKDRAAFLAEYRTAKAARDRLRVDSRKWYTSKIAPRIYGDKLDITTNGESLAPAVVILPTPDGLLVPPEDGAGLDEAAPAVLAGGAPEGARMMELLYQYRQGNLNGANSFRRENGNGNGVHE